MGYAEFEWRTEDGTRMFTCEWRPAGDEPARAVVCLVHGMGEHAGRYTHMAEWLVARGYAVLAFDQRGHGRTEGRRGHTPDYDALLEGVGLMLKEAELRHPGVPRFLFGHSMGGNVTLNYMLRRQPEVAGAIVTGPWLRLAFAPPRLTVIVGRLIERFIPNFSNARPLSAEKLTSDPDMQRRYVTDPLGHGVITVRFFFSVQKAGLWAIRNAGLIRVPLLLMHASEDQITSAAASREFAGQVADPRFTFREWPGFKHELHNDLGREEVFHAVSEWIAQRLNQR